MKRGGELDRPVEQEVEKRDWWDDPDRPHWLTEQEVDDELRKLEAEMLAAARRRVRNSKRRR